MTITPTEPALVLALVAGERELAGELAMGDPASELLRRFEAARAPLLAALADDAAVADAFAGTPAERSALLGTLFDAVLLAARSPAPAEDFSAWFGVFNKLASACGRANASGLANLALVHCLSIMDDQAVMRLLHQLDHFEATARLYLMQGRVAAQSQPIAARIAAQCGLSDDADLCARLSAWLHEWGRNPPSAAVRANALFILGFVQQVVPGRAWPMATLERLLIATDLELQRAVPPGQGSDIADAIEVLVAAVPQFNAFAQLLVHLESRPVAEQQLGQAVVMQAMATCRPAGAFGLQWANALDTAALHRCGWSAAGIHGTLQPVMETLRRHMERHEIDGIARAARRLQAWCTARADAEALSQAAGQRLQALAASLVEGVADTESRQRALRQIDALVRLGVHCSQIAEDPRVGRQVMRARIALNLNCVRDLAVWKRNKQVAATFLQLDEVTGVPANALRGLQAMAADIEAVITSQIRFPLQWIRGSAVGTEPGARPSEIQVLAARWAHSTRLHGAEGAPARMRQWCVRWLMGLPGHFEAMPLERALYELLHQGWLVPGCDPLRDGLLQWLGQIPVCAAASNLRWSLPGVVERCIALGQARYEEKLLQRKAPAMAIGVADAWAKGRLDATWTLQKLSAVIQSGENPIDDALFGWWQLAVGKHISAVPEAFVRVFLQALSEALDEALPREESSALFRPVFACHQRMFGLKGGSGAAELIGFGPLPDRAGAWQPVLTGSDSTHPLRTHLASLGAVAPAALQPWAVHALHSADTEADAEAYWLRQHAPLYAMATTLGPFALDQALLCWQLDGMKVLPAGAAAYWLAWCDRARQAHEQVLVGERLIAMADQIGKTAAPKLRELASGGDDRLPDGSPAVWLLRQCGVRLLAGCTSTAALDIARLHAYLVAVHPAAGAANLLRLWLIAEAVMRQNASPPLERGLMRWLVQCLGVLDRLDDARPVAAMLFGTDEFSLAEGRADELRWRDATSALLAAAMTDDTLPVPGAGLVGRVLLSCEAFANETVASWNERSRALVQLVAEHGSSALGTSLGLRAAMLFKRLQDRSRIADMPSLDGAHRAMVLLQNDVSGPREFSRRQALQRVDTPDALPAPEEGFVRALLQEANAPPPRARGDAQAQLLALRYEAPAALQRRKLLSRETVSFNQIEVRLLSRLARAVHAADVAGPGVVQHAVQEAAQHFSRLGEPSERLSLWLAQQGAAIANGGAANDWQGLLGDHLAGWRLHQARSRAAHPEASAALTLLKDASRFHLVAFLCAMHASNGAAALHRMRERLAGPDWKVYAARLENWLKLLEEARQQPRSEGLLALRAMLQGTGSSQGAQETANA